MCQTQVHIIILDPCCTCIGTHNILIREVLSFISDVGFLGMEILKGPRSSKSVRNSLLSKGRFSVHDFAAGPQATVADGDKEFPLRHRQVSKVILNVFVM